MAYYSFLYLKYYRSYSSKRKKLQFPKNGNLQKKSRQNADVKIAMDGDGKSHLKSLKIAIIELYDVDNLHKKFGDDILKIVDFFLMCNFC